MKIGEMTGRQILDAIARALEESGRPFDQESDTSLPAIAAVAETIVVFDSAS